MMIKHLRPWSNIRCFSPCPLRTVAILRTRTELIDFPPHDVRFGKLTCCTKQNGSRNDWVEDFRSQSGTHGDWEVLLCFDCISSTLRQLCVSHWPLPSCTIFLPKIAKYNTFVVFDPVLLQSSRLQHPRTLGLSKLKISFLDVKCSATAKFFRWIFPSWQLP